MKLAVIDIGSNAIRMQISQPIEHDNQLYFKQVEYIRFPLRLGEDAFTYHHIAKNTEEKFVRLMQTYKSFIDLYEVDAYMICATSAMREAENAQRIVDRVYYTSGLNIEIIDGYREAQLIDSSLKQVVLYPNYIHIDVGGGSTEINIHLNREKVAAKSFKIGSVRKHDDNQYAELVNWVRKKSGLLSDATIAVGTGGNINKVFELAKKKDDDLLTVSEIRRVRDYIASFNYMERIAVLKLNEDRADVILPAIDIYILAMETARVDKITVPKLGLKDGMMYELYQTYHSQLSKRANKPINDEE